MSQHKTLAVVLSILLAVVVPLITAYKANSDQKPYPSIRVDIEPYDPRDLMYGHYLTFKIKWNIAEKDPAKAACHGNDCCLCVGEGDVNPPASLKSCLPSEALASCRFTFKGYWNGGDAFDIGINRYYVDESHALPLEHLFRDKREKFSVAFGVKPNGKAVLRDLFVGDQALHEYVAGHNGVIPEPAKAP